MAADELDWNIAPLSPGDSVPASGSDSEEGIACLDFQGNITHWNSGAEGLARYPASRVRGRSFSLLLGEEEQSRDRLSLLLASAREGFRLSGENSERRREGPT